MNEVHATAGIIVNDEGELDILLPYEMPEDPDDICYFLFALHFMAVNDPDFQEYVMNEVRKDPDFMEFVRNGNDETVH